MFTLMASISNARAIKSQRGSVIVMSVIALVALIAITGLALDSGHLLLTKTRLQNLVDAAALSAGKTLQINGEKSTAKLDAIDTFERSGMGQNLSSPENHGIKQDYDSGSLVLTVEFSETYEPHEANPFPVIDDTDVTTPANFVRVTASPVSLSTSLLKVLNINTLEVSAVAIAGHTPPLVEDVCGIAPFMMCGNDPELDIPEDDPENEATYFGYTYEKPVVIKIGANQDSPIGSGNFQLIQVSGPGGNIVRDAAAGVDSDFCLSVSDGVPIEEVDTKTGNTVGPVVQGLNTRFGTYDGAASQFSSDDYPADFYSTQATPPLEIDDDGNITVTYSGNTINLDETTIVDGTDIKEYPGYYQEYSQSYNPPDSDPPYTEGSPAFERRIITVPVGKCLDPENGQHSAEVWGFSCVYLTQEVTQHGNDAHVYAQVLDKNCANSGGFDDDTTGKGTTNVVLHD